LYILNNQDRRYFTYDSKNKVITPATKTIADVIPATISSFTLQIPATELTADPKLADKPVAYFK